MEIKEIKSKTILSISKIYPYVINPYVGCQHACSYCYARYMKRFTHHIEPWGEFVDVKVNAIELLRKEIAKKEKKEVWISGVCDPYQPLEKRYELTHGCLEILVENDWPFVIQTRSPLVLRDIEILKKSRKCSVGFSISTKNDKIRKIFEPNAPKINERINSLEILHNAGIKTYVMIAPILPEAQTLMDLLIGKVDYIYVDRMNYHFSDRKYKDHKLEDCLKVDYFYAVGKEIKKRCAQNAIKCSVFF